MKSVRSSSETDRLQSIPELVSLWKAADLTHLPATLTALARIPLGIQPAVLEAADSEFKQSFFELASVLLDSGPASIERKPVVIANSAKLAAFSMVSYLGFLPWHVVGGELSAEIVEVISESADHGRIQSILAKAGAVNLFVAARDNDDRESYIRSCRALLGRIKVARIVLDAELVSFLPSGDFTSLCDNLGLGANFVGVSERANAKSHSIFSNTMFKGVFVDSEGRQLKGPAGSASITHDELVDQAMQPSTETHSRISALKSRQAAAARRSP